MNLAAAAAAGVIACALASGAGADESIVIPTRPGITVELRLVPASGTPRAAVLLFPGGNGIAGGGSQNFLVRDARRPG